MTRQEMYSFIRNNNLQKDIIVMFGSNYTNVSNNQLEKFIAGFKNLNLNIPTQSAKETIKSSVQITDIPTEIEKIKNAFVQLVSTLTADDTLYVEDSENILSKLQ